MRALTRRSGVVLAVLATAVSAGPGASAAGGIDRVTNRETVQADLRSDGSVKVARLFSQLVVEGDGSIHVVDPTSTKNLRDLDGFSKPSTSGGNAVWNVDVNGRAVRRTVSDFTRDLPVDVSVTYALNGRAIKPGDVVGKSGTLTATYRVRNTTGTPTPITFTDGKGVRHVEFVDVPTPLVGQLQTTLPRSFTDVDSPRADIAGDGRGANLLTWTMVLFSPIGETEQEFGWTAHVKDAIAPKASVQIVPVPPKRKPELKFGEDGFADGAHAASQLTDGAGQIDANVLKLRDGAATLLDGLGQLAAGAATLKAGLAGEAAPGSKELADGAAKAKDGSSLLAAGLVDANAGAERLADGLGIANDGGQQLLTGSQDLAAGAGLTANGAGQVATGAGDLATGAGQVASGAGLLSTGAGTAAAGAASLATGLHTISDGLAQLAGVTGLPAAKAGAVALQQGVAAILAGIGSAATPGTILNGLAQIGGGLTALGSTTTGLPAAKGGVDAVNAGLATAKTSLQGLQAAIGGSVAEITGSAVARLPGFVEPRLPVARLRAELLARAVHGGVAGPRGAGGGHR